MKQLHSFYQKKAWFSILIVFLLFSFPAVAQQTVINGTIFDFPSQTIKVSSFFGDKLTLVDSTKTDASGHFSITFGGERHPGVYRFIFGKASFIELIHNFENFTFTTYAKAPEDSLKLQNTVENLIYHNFKRFDESAKIRLELLDNLVKNYPEFDNFFVTAVMEYEAIQNARDSVVNTIPKNHPDLFASKIIRMQWMPRINPLSDSYEKLMYAREHFFDSLSFASQDLMFTNVYTNKLIRFLSMYANPEFTKAELDSSFSMALKVIMEKTRQDKTVYDFLIEYLVGGFEKYDLDNTLNYISANYEPLNCENPDYKTALQRKLGNYQYLMIGRTAPDFTVQDITGNPVKLSDQKSQYVLVMFWASWCPHCTEILPKISKWIDKVNKSPQMGGFTERLKIISISLDNEEKSWKDFLSKGKYNWINSCDMKGWSSPIVELYNIFATPTMFLLDSNRKIIAKPITFEELEKLFQ